VITAPRTRFLNSSIAPMKTSRRFSSLSRSPGLRKRLSGRRTSDRRPVPRPRSIFSAPRTRSAIVAGDVQGAGAAAHGLKGSAGSIGASRLADLCAEMERRAGTNGSDCSELLQAVAAEFDALNQILQRDYCVPCGLGSASATSEVLPAAPVANTMYCRPLCMNVMGTALVFAGMSTAATCLPVALSTA
jgi:Hpt domain-containing protein